eukprot:2173102-Pyramimonas_sp.AAC.1
MAAPLLGLCAALYVELLWASAPEPLAGPRRGRCASLSAVLYVEPSGPMCAPVPGGPSGRWSAGGQGP